MLEQYQGRAGEQKHRRQGVKTDLNRGETSEKLGSDPSMAMETKNQAKIGVDKQDLKSETWSTKGRHGSEGRKQR